MTLLLAATVAGLALAVGLLLRRLHSLKARLGFMGQELEKVQRSCALLAPAGIVQRVVSDGLEGAAEHKVVTALFVDLVGYTALSEKLPAAVLARVLNGYFERVSDAVTAANGRVATFLGDGVLCFFGALEPNPWQCNDAVGAALEIRASLAEYSAVLEREGLPAIRAGIGIHRGPGLAGLIGTRARREYTVVGPTVNIAARVQALTRTHGTDILVTESVRAELDPRLELAPYAPVAVRGLAGEVATYGVLGMR